MNKTELNQMVSMCGSRDAAGRIIVMVHTACGRPVFSCCDPACVGELHHYEGGDHYDLGTCEFSVPIKECVKNEDYHD